MTRVAILAIALLAGPVLAAPDHSLRPTARFEPPAEVRVPAAQTRIRPQLRPAVTAQSARVPRPGQPLTVSGLVISLRPVLRPTVNEQQVVSKRRTRQKGGVCDHPHIQGENIGRVPGRLNGCGLNDAVRVRSVSGVRLSRPATMDCTTAKALNQWVDKAVKPAFRRRGKVVELRVAAHYTCRTRNSQPGARISEHGKGKAIDISAFTMKNGKVITVLGDWGKGKSGKALAEVHKKACGPFGTVLGPRADRHHQDHFHLDTASYRSGPYCR